jgi:hypothetical protein
MIKLVSMKKISTIFSLFIIILIFNSCSRDTLNYDLDLGKKYFPLETGKYIEYSLDSTIFDNFLGITYINKYVVKDIIDSLFIDLSGDTSYIVSRYSRPIKDTNFTFKKVYYITKQPYQMQVVEDNIKIIKLSFPIAYNKRWDGNIYTGSGSETWMANWLGYKYQEIGKPFSTDSLTFNNTITVFQQNNTLEQTTVKNDTSINNKDYGEFIFGTEVYASGIGMIEKRLVHYTSGTANVGGNGTPNEKKKKGFGVVYKAIRHN